MRIKELNSRSLLSLALYEIDCAFIELFSRSESIGGVHTSILNQVKSSNPRYKKIINSDFEFDYVKNRNYLYNIPKEILRLPLKSIAFPTLSPRYRNLILSLERNIKVGDILNIISAISKEKNVWSDIDALNSEAVSVKITGINDWQNEIKTAIIFHSINFKGYNNLYHNKNKDSITYLFDDEKPIEENIKIIKNLDNFFPKEFFKFYPIHRIFRSYEDSAIQDIFDISLDAIKSIGINSSQVTYMTKLIGLLPRLYDLENKKFDFSQSRLPDHIGNLSIYTLSPLIKDQKALLKKIDKFHKLGSRSLNSMVVLLFWKQLNSGDILNYLKNPNKFSRTVKTIATKGEKEYKRSVEQKKKFNIVKNRGSKLNRLLYEEIKKLRYDLAKDHGLPIYMIYSNETARSIATVCPQNSEELLFIAGFGKWKVSRYGNKILDKVKKFN